MTIHLSKAEATEVEEAFVLDALRSGWLAPLGPHVDAFEEEIANLVGVRHALAVSSGTAALHLALLELGAGPGRSVLLPTMTFAASANAVLYTGAQPVFVDARDSDGNIDPAILHDAIPRLLRNGANICAVMTVDLFGRPAEYDAILPLLEGLDIPLVEDAAEAFGSTYGGRHAGSFGNMAALSFNGNKILTTSGGGMLLSNDAALIAHARKLSTQAREPTPWYEHTEVGFNYRMSNILAALGRGQLRRFDQMLARRRAIRARYASAFQDVPQIRVLGDCDSHISDNAWLTCITLQDCHIDASDLIEQLNHRGVEARHLWKPMHTQPIFRDAQVFGGAASERLFKMGLALPSGAHLTDVDIDFVISSVLQVLDVNS